MNCTECQDLLSEYIDGDLAQSESAMVRTHLAICYECNVVYQDLDQIVRMSHELPSLAPQNALWAQIEREIDELVQRPPRRPQQNLWQRFWGYRLQLSLSIPQMAAAIVGLFLLMTLTNSLTYLPQGNMFGTNAAPNASTVTAMPVDRINIEESEMRGRIERLTHTIEQKRGSWDPEIQKLYERNLQIIERSVTECRQLVERNPSDQIAHEMMMVAYQEKLRLLEQFSTL